MLLVFVFPLYAVAQESATSPGSMRLEQKREAVRIKREEFKVNLQTIRDVAKRSLVVRIDSRIGSVNQRVTNRFSTILNKLQSILNKFIERMQDASLAGKDTTDLDAAIGIAQVAVENAKTAVSTQSANMYTIEIASESALRSDVGETISQFRADLTAVHKMIVDAKQAVQKVVMEYAKLRGNLLGEDHTATSSSQ